MQLSDAPEQIVEAWGTGDSSKTNPIPVPSQIGVKPGAASWTDGFPPLCDTPLASGGIPPAKADMNGGLYQMSAVDVWMCAGAGFPYSPTFSSAVGGYPQGARVQMASGNGHWVSTVDNNTTDPDTSGAGWVGVLVPSGVTPGSYSGANITVNAAGQVTEATSGTSSGSNVNGYWTKLPNGLILQFGTITWTGGGTGPYAAFTFPTPFASTNYSISGSASTLCIGGAPIGSGDIPILAFFNFSDTGADWRMDSNGGVNFGSSVTFSWMAIGF
jgi:hypothetical protein